jgi:hypothetical protein
MSVSEEFVTYNNLDNDGSIIFQAGLFWGNLPEPFNTNLGFLKEAILRYKIIKNINTPYFIFTSMEDINLDPFKSQLDVMKVLKKQPVHFYLYEPVIYNIDHQPYTLGYYSEFHNLDNSKLRVVELDKLVKFSKETGVRFIVHVCDYNLKKMYNTRYRDLTLIVDDIFIKTNTRPYLSIPPKVKIKKHFWSTNSRYTPHRHMIMNYLADKSGNYSWRFDADIKLLQKSHPWIETEYLPWDIMLENDQILNKSNFYIDHQLDKVSVINYNQWNNPSTYGLPKNEDFFNSIRECFCAVIGETRFAQPTANFSEKVLHAMETLTPFVIAAPPHTLQYLHDLGFKTFSDYWDESYDLEENHSKRLAKIFKIVDQINLLSLKECKQLRREMRSILKHNFNILKYKAISKKQLYK